MLQNDHPAVSPPTSNCTLWRYTDLAKLLSLLEDRQLYLPRCDQFEDPYEGTLSRVGVAAMRRMAEENDIPQTAIDLQIQGQASFRSSMFMSCWFESEHESAAMWKLYLQSPDGVAIRTNHGALAAALEASPLRARTSSVSYIDYDVYPLTTSNIIFPFKHKRLSFAHEREVRALVWGREDVNEPQINKDDIAVRIAVEPNDFVHAIHVSPTAPAWFGSLIAKIVQRYGFSIPVVRSTLYDRPTY